MSLQSLKICVEKIANLPINQKPAAAFLKQKLWPINSIIKISFIDTETPPKWTSIGLLEIKGKGGIDPFEQQIRTLSHTEAIKKIVEERFQPLVGLTFVFVESGGDIRISFNKDDGSWSLIGTDCLESKDKSTMNFGWLDCGTIMHEFGHVLGMIHEHQNPRGKTIEWDYTKVYEWAKKTYDWNKDDTFSNIIQKYKINTLNGSSYDSESIMLYFFPSYLTFNDKGVEQNFRLSKEDVIWISKIYPGGKMKPSDFYQSVYNESIKPSINILKISLVIIFSISVIVLLLFMYFKKRTKKVVET